MSGLPDPLRLLAVVALAVAVGACGSTTRVSDVSVYQGTFQLLEELRISAVWVDDACTYFVYERGAFSADPGSDLCYVQDKGPGRPFDAEARTDLRRLLDDIEGKAGRLEYAAIEYTSSGGISTAFFQPSPCETVVFEPGYDRLPAGEELLEQTARRVDADWYAIEGC